MGNIIEDDLILNELYPDPNNVFNHIEPPALIKLIGFSYNYLSFEYPNRNGITITGCYKREYLDYLNATGKFVPPIDKDNKI